MRSRTGLALIALVALAVGACDGGGGRRSSTTTTTRPSARSSTSGTSTDEIEVELDWDDCGDGVECATLAVPLDDADPDGSAIDLALTRLPHRGAGEAIGSLIVNPGGPGASGNETVHPIASLLPREVRQRFDIVSWDTRGVGDSAPVECQAGDLDAFFAIDTSPDSATEVDELRATAEELASDCTGGEPDVRPFLSTERSARDLDRIRAAVGDEKLTYLGYSYGTYLGALYAEQFPSKVRAMVLDGAVDPSLDYETFSRQQAQGFEGSLDLFLDECARDDGCAFHSDGDPRRAYDALMATIDREGLDTRGRGGRRLTPGLADLGVAEALYGGEYGWDQLADALRDAERGDGSGLLDLADYYTGRLPGGGYESNFQDAFFAISCVDGPVPTDPAAFTAMAERVAAAAPRFGAANAYLGLPCLYWPARPTHVPAPIAAEGAPPIVVIGATDDPATPLANAEALASQLADGVLIVYQSAMHTSFPAGDECLDDVVVRYLVDLEIPGEGLRCG